MNLFVDVTGSFVSSSSKDSWNAVGCYALSNDDYNRSKQILKDIKTCNGFSKFDEIGINDISEAAYSEFLSKLGKLEGTFYAVATNTRLNTIDSVERHKQNQANKIMENIDKMKHQSGKEAVLSLKNKVECLPGQLYTQLACQLGLMFKVVQTIVPYYIQRTPQALSSFKWRIDRKNISALTEFEKAFEILTPMIIQTRSFSDPLIMIKGYDYSVMKRYEYKSPPAYLKDTYGIEVGEGYDIQGIFRDDIDFVDSRKNVGVQIVDLICSGLRRCFRLEFDNNRQIAELLGALMVQAKGNDIPIELISFSVDEDIEGELKNLIHIMDRKSRQFLK
jgi:hypothetical protein